MNLLNIGECIKGYNFSPPPPIKCPPFTMMSIRWNYKTIKDALIIESQVRKSIK
jgi:hypothetical protein